MDFNVGYDLSSKFNFRVAGLKVKVTLAIFRRKKKEKKNFVIILAFVFISGF